MLEVSTPRVGRFVIPKYIKFKQIILINEHLHEKDRPFIINIHPAKSNVTFISIMF